MKLTVGDLRREADGLFARGEYAAALRAYVSVLSRVPEDHTVRQAIGDALVHGGYIEQAAAVYQATARLCIEGGLPFAACVAIFALEALERPSAKEQGRALREELVRVYARGSERIGAVGARLNVLYPEDVYVSGKELRKERTIAQLVEQATTLGADLSTVGQLPPAFPMPALVGHLGPERFHALLDHLWVHRLPTGHVLMRRGDVGRSCYIIARGRLRVSAPDDMGEERELATLAAGTLVGEMALITGAPRLATVTVTEAADVLELGAGALEAIGKDLDQLAPVLDQIAQNRWLKNLLDQSPFFRPFDAEQRRQLLARCSAYEVPAETTLFERGEVVKGVYLLLRGEVRLDGDEELVLAAGGMAGVRSALTSAPAEAAARTTSPSTVLFLSAGSVQRLRDAVPAFAEQLAEVARARIEQLTGEHRVQPELLKR